VLLVVTGAGFSADSGLATYDDVADIEAYRSRGWTYMGLCKPPGFTDFSEMENADNNNSEQKNNSCSGEENTSTKAAVNVEEDAQQHVDGEKNRSAGGKAEGEEAEASVRLGGAQQKNDTINNGDIMELDSWESKNDIGEESNENYNLGENCSRPLPDENDIDHPQHFYGFWGQCCNDYRRVKPHDGYDILARWGRDKNTVPMNESEQTSGTDVGSTSNSEKNQSDTAKEIRKLTHMLEHSGKDHGSDDSDSSDDSNCFQFKEDSEEEPYYVSPTKRAGAFFLFTSNVDAHSFDVFESHDIREVHGNVEMWQCHNFACGMNDTALGNAGLSNGVDGAAAVGAYAGGKRPQTQIGRRRLWCLPKDFNFVVDKNTMCAPYSKSPSVTQATEKVAESVATKGSSGSPPALKRRKSSNGSIASSLSEHEKQRCRTDINSDARADRGEENKKDVNHAFETATALGGIMEDALRNHLGKESNENTSSNDIDSTEPSNEQPSHIGDVHGKPRLFPLRHMYPPTTGDDPIANKASKNYYLPISENENWPRCPRCHEAARPAVLMFGDLDWVYNLAQERRWQRWCSSLLRLCKMRSRQSDAGHDVIDSDSASTVSDANMSENGWKDVEPAHSTEQNHGETAPSSTTPSSPATSGQLKNTAAASSHPSSSFSKNQSPVADTSMRENGPKDAESAHSTDQKHDEPAPSSIIAPPPTDPDQSKNTASALPPSPTSISTTPSPLKVAILEIGCGYNVPTCRTIAERVVGELVMRGGEATLVRINPSHPETDDESVEDFVISIMEKGLPALKLIDEHYCALAKEGRSPDQN